MNISNEVNIDYFTRNSAIGGYGGKPFKFLGIQDGKRLDRISIWAYSEYYITGLEVTLSNGDLLMNGTKDGELHQIYVGKDTLTEIKIQIEKCYDDTRVGYILVKTSSGKRLEVNHIKRGMPVETIDVGSGICFGVFGRSGSDIDSLGFAMLRPVNESIMTDIVYSDKKPSSEECEIMQETFRNATKEKQTFNASASLTFVEKSSWSHDVHFDLEISAKENIPFLEQGGITFKAGYKYVQSKEESTSKTKSWSWPIVCPPETITKANATIKRRTVDLRYTAELAFYLNNGKVFKIPVKGKYDHADINDAEIQIEQYPLKEFLK